MYCTFAMTAAEIAVFILRARETAPFSEPAFITSTLASTFLCIWQFALTVATAH
jgi:hypothetical protein